MPFLLNLLIGLALSLASTLIQSMFQQDKAQEEQKQTGLQGSMKIGGDNPLSFIMGFYATAGSLEYVGTWSEGGQTPNARLTKVITLSDLPCRRWAGLFINGVRCNLDIAGEDAYLGFPVLEYRVDGVDHLWAKVHLGDQITADNLMLTAFGADPDRPWLSDMIGTGLCYAIITAHYNREVFNGEPEALWEIEGIAVEDSRGDDSWQNPIVGIRTILGGIYYDGTWVYGPQGIGAGRMPEANWEAEMDKCDALVEGDPRYQFGIEVTADTEPHVIIGELLKACAGRIAEIGGIYKVLVGAPNAPVVSIIDEDIIITEGQSYEPFPGLESTYNAITATYPEPDEAWESRDAPPRYRTDLEPSDDGRRLPFSANYAAVPYPVQVQRLMLAAIEETRRFRRHTSTMPPEFWEYEPLDVLEWSSDRNGYEAKQFLITVMEDLPNANQFVGLQEIDPADYDWVAAYELPWDVNPLPLARPTPQMMTGWQALPATIDDNDGTPRRPSIEVEYDGGLADVSAVRVQVRLAGETALAFDGEVPYDAAIPTPSRVLNGTFLPNTNYEVRGKYVPFSGRVTRWSNQDENGTEGAWLGVTTPDVRIGPDDFYPLDLTAFGEQFTDMIEYLGRSVRGISLAQQRLAQIMDEQDLAQWDDRQFLTRQLVSTTGTVRAEFTELITVATSEISAVAESVTSLYVAMGGSEAFVNVRFSAEAAPSGFSAKYGIQAAVDDGVFRSAAMWLLVPPSPSDPTRIVFDADEIVVSNDGGTTVAALFTAGTTYIANARIQNLTAANISAGAITATEIAANTITASEIAVKSLDADEILIDGTLITDLIAANAVNDIYYFSNDPDVTCTAAGAYTTLVSGSVTVLSSAAGVVLSFNTLGRYSGSDGYPQFRIQFNSSVIDSFTGNYLFNSLGFGPKRFQTSYQYKHSPGSSGTFTYLVEVRVATNDPASSFVAAVFNNNRMTAATVKR